MSFRLWIILTCLLLLAGFGLHTLAGWVIVAVGLFAVLLGAVLTSRVGQVILENLALIRFIGRGGN